MKRSPGFVFGPVPSRRLGRSLGIDVIPRKTCTFDCIYCECGRTTNLTITRSSFANPESVLEQLKEYFTSEASAPVDVITFSGFGEPTLYTQIDELLYEIKRLYPEIPVGVLTNGSLLWDAEVRKALLPADFVIPSLDAPSPEVWQRINRPHPAISWEQYLQGLIAFRNEYSGSYILEIFLVKGINDKVETLEGFADLLERVRPDSVDLNTLARPGTDPEARGLSPEELRKAAEILRFPKCRIIGQYQKKHRKKPLFSPSLLDNVMAVISRRPCTADELADSMALPADLLADFLEELAGSGRVIKKKIGTKVFYSAFPAE